MPTVGDVQRGQQLQQLRTRANLTQRAVATHFDVATSAVSEWERGRSRPAVDKLAELDRLYRAKGEVLTMYGIPTAPPGDAPSPAAERLADEIVASTAAVVAALRRIEERLGAVEESIGVVRSAVVAPARSPSGTTPPGRRSTGKARRSTPLHS